ncbi:MAG: hypothetical protein IKG46_14185 [Solobacterium sp.]|nr:hypothetical protein [Solobacterium sp.]
MKKRLPELITIGIFLVFLFAFTAGNIFAEKKDFSENENRSLAPFPSLSAANIFGGDFDTQFESWFSDHFVGRDGWIEAKALTRKTLGAIENNNVYFAKGSRLIQQFASYDPDRFQNNIEYIEEFCTDTGRTGNILIIPDACFGAEKALPFGAWNIDENILLDVVADTVQGQNVIDLREMLNDPHYYFRTDHHWNASGAYQGYKAICAQVLATEPKRFMMTPVTAEFRGTMFSRSGAFWSRGEALERIDCEQPFNAALVFEDGSVMYSLYNEERLKTKDKYTYYIDGNHAFTEIHTDCGTGRSAVIVKDSYSHILMPYLAAEYSTIRLVDLRYYQGAVSSLLEEDPQADLYFIYSLNTLVTDSSLGMLW